MSFLKQSKPQPSANRTNEIFVRPTAMHIAKMNRENPDRNVPNIDADQKINHNPLGAPSIVRPQLLAHSYKRKEQDAVNNESDTRRLDTTKMKKTNSPIKEEAPSLSDEIAHSVPQNESLTKIQRAIEPEQVSEEMIGKGFFLDREIKVDYNSGSVTFPKWQYVKIKRWDNSNTKVRVSAFHKEIKKKYEFSVRKNWITPVADTKSELYKYEVGLNDVKNNIDSGAKAIDSWKSKKSEYEKYGTMNIYNAQLENLEQLQTNRYLDMNRKLIQESMYNDFDAIIKQWTDYYNESIGEPKGWSKLDANLVKSMVFQESEMGTSGVHLDDISFAETPKTRFNLMQMIDSSGIALTLMMKEMNLTLYNKYDLKVVTSDYYATKKKYRELINKGNLNLSEQRELDKINVKVADHWSGAGKQWDSFFWRDSRFIQAWKEFNSEPSGKDRNQSYSFWVRAGIRWLFEKRSSVNNWEEAIKAYNGSGDKANNYKNYVVARRDLAKKSANNSTKHIPTRKN